MSSDKNENQVVATPVTTDPTQAAQPVEVTTDSAQDAAPVDAGTTTADKED